jgi:N6-adenosine-specific RNA methylase IME4
MKYKVIYADPPWHFKVWSAKGEGRSAKNHYPVMSLEDIKSLPVSDIAEDDCVLFLWCVAPLLPQALEVINAWGFIYKTKGFSWVKLNKSGSGLFTGMGFWTRANTEDCLLATKGSPKRIDKSVPQVVLAPREQHSRKPTEVRRRIVRLMGDVPRIELFARDRSPGWSVWGNEVKSDIRLTHKAGQEGNEALVQYADWGEAEL